MQEKTRLKISQIATEPHIDGQNGNVIMESLNFENPKFISRIKLLAEEK